MAGVYRFLSFFNKNLFFKGNWENPLLNTLVTSASFIWRRLHSYDVIVGKILSKGFCSFFLITPVLQFLFSFTLATWAYAASVGSAASWIRGNVWKPICPPLTFPFEDSLLFEIPTCPRQSSSVHLRGCSLWEDAGVCGTPFWFAWAVPLRHANWGSFTSKVACALKANM